MIDKVTIRAHWLGIMLLLRMAVRVMSAFSWNFPVHDLTEPWNLLKLLTGRLTDLGQQNYLIRIQSSMQATPLDQDFYGVWVYSPQSQYKSWIPDGSTNTMRRVKCEISVTVTSRKYFVRTPKPFDPILSRCPSFRITFSTI